MSSTHRNALHFIPRDDTILARALDAVVERYKSGVLHEVIIQPHEPTRTLGQNSNYWCALREYLRELNDIVNRMVSHTGNDAMDIKRELARRLQPEYAGIVFARNEDIAHEFIKLICNIPTSTNLKRKRKEGGDFPEFREKMAATMNEIIGEAMALENYAREP